MENRVIIAGGGNRGMCFAHMLAHDLRRPVMAIVENDTARHAPIRQCLAGWGMSDTALYTTLPRALAAIPRAQANVVFVMTPDWTHLEVLRPAISAGCHVFLEKPLATTPEDILEIVRMAHATDRTVQVGFVLRYSSFIRKVKAIVDSGALGRLVMIQMNERLSLKHGAVFCRSWHRKVRYTGGFLNEKCSHDLDLLCWLKEGQATPREVFSHGGRHFTPRRDTPETCSRCRRRHCPWRGDGARCVFHSDGDILDHQSVSVLFSDGTQGQFTVAAMSPVPGRDLRLFGTDGYLEGTMETGALRLKRYWDPSGLEDISVAASDGHGGGDTRIVAEFMDCVDRHEQPLSSVLDGARASLLAFAADRSVTTHRAIPFAGIVRRLTAEGRRHERVKGRLAPLAGRGFDANLVVNGARRAAGFDFTIGNPTDWPLDVRLSFNVTGARILPDRSQNQTFSIRQGTVVVTLDAHERKALRLPGRKGRLTGVLASVTAGQTDNMRHFISEKTALYQRVQALTDVDLEKILRHLQSEKSVRELRRDTRLLLSAAARGDGLTLANRTGGYFMSRLENCLRLVPAEGQRALPHPARLFVACGSREAFTDAAGRTWRPTQPWIEGVSLWGNIGGTASVFPPTPIRGTRDPRAYWNDWHGMTGFRFRVANGFYTVRLHFAETSFDRIGQRRFTVRLQDRPVLEALDVLKEAGGKYRALVRTFSVAVTNGVLAVDFSPERDAPTNVPMVCGIEVIRTGKQRSVAV